MNCPNCNRLLYSRIQPKCGYCGAVLPSECRLPEEEVEKLKEEQAAIAARRVAAKEKEENEEKERKAWRRRFHNDAGFLHGGL